MNKKKLQEGFGLGELPSSKLMKMSMKLSDIMGGNQDQHYTPVNPSNANHLQNEPTFDLGKVYSNPYAKAFVPVNNSPETSDCGDTMPDQEETDARHHLITAIKQDLDEKIKKVEDGWAVYPSKGGKRLGTHPTKKEALKQLAAIEISKQKK